MGIRETINQNQKLGVALGGIFVVAVVGLLVWQLMHTGPSGPTVTSAFYTTDDGETLFADRENRVPPFDHSGSDAVRAYVFVCDGKQFVGYLERFTPESQKILADFAAELETIKPGDDPPANLAKVQVARRSGREVKKPGTAEWVPMNSRKGSEVRKITCPDGKRANSVRP